MSHKLSHKVIVDNITGKKHCVVIEASEDEYPELIKRLGILGIKNLKAKVILQRKDKIIQVNGNFSCDAVQECVVSLKPVTSCIGNDFEMAFCEEPQEMTEDGIMDINAMDVVENGVINLGDVIAEQISLALPDYPKAKDAEFFDYIEAPEALETKGKPTRRPFAELLKDVVVSDGEDKA